MTYRACPACGSPCLILFLQPLCVFVGCRWFDQRTYEPVRDEERARSADPWAETDAA